MNALLCESSINVNENIILPKCSTLVVLRYTHMEGADLDRKDWNNTVQNGLVERRADRTSAVQNRPVERKDHNFHFQDSMKAHEHLLESSSSLLSNATGDDLFGNASKAANLF